ncbi:TetR family transcriptional regulator [Mycobacterium sp. 1100029.7]|nr:TetR family transcriptional regulator [Mycobacterium sp. 1100029.7]
MPRRSDAKHRMISAATELVRERGYSATAFADVLQASGAPRGSVYFHFPGGKAELAAEAARAHAHNQIAIIDSVADASQSAEQLVERYVELGRKGMIASNYSRGCGVAPLVIEGAADGLGEVTKQAFSEMVARLAFHFIAFGVERADARTLADAVIAGVEGAMITSRALRSPAPYHAVAKALTAHAASVSPKKSRSKRD